MFNKNKHKKYIPEEDLSKTTPEYRLMSEILRMISKDKERTSMWGALFRLAIILYVITVTFIVIGLFQHNDMAQSDVPHVALIELSGTIDATGKASADKLMAGLGRAMKEALVKGVIVRANSPGGSPVQSAYVNDEITRLRGQYPDKPIYFVITDMCASGCYYMASAANEIYANKGSIVGSIGVVMNGFGFTGVMEKLGIERRMLTAGDSKGMLDPFSPLKQDDVAHTKAMLEVIHEQFIAVVKQGRGEKLVDDPHLFSGRFWAGEQALELGLVDGLISSANLAKLKFDTDNIVNYSVHGSSFAKVFKRLGAKVSISDVFEATPVLQ